MKESGNALELSSNNVEQVKPLEGYQDIVCHGDAYGFVIRNADGVETNLTLREFAEILQQTPGFEKGKPIRLMACEAGAGEGLPAQYLADLFGVEVIAPTDVLIIAPDGTMKIGENNNGTWKRFKPRER